MRHAIDLHMHELCMHVAVRVIILLLYTIYVHYQNNIVSLLLIVIVRFQFIGTHTLPNVQIIYIIVIIQLILYRVAHKVARQPYTHS